MRSVESSAKTMEEAVTQGLEKLGVSFADVKIDILDEGSKGFLGILGGKPVVVRLTVREDVEGGEDVLSSVALEDAVKEPEQKPARKRKPKADKPEDKPEKPAAQEKADQPKAHRAEKPAKAPKPARPKKRHRGLAAAIIAVVLPLPLVPATWIKFRPFWGFPSRSSKWPMVSRPSLEPKRSCEAI